VNVPEKVDLVLASCGGAPFDDDLLKAFRSIRNAARILKENGTLILVAECGHGAGSSKFLNYFESKSDDGLAEQLLHEYRSYGNTALAFRELVQRFEVTIVGKLSDQEAHHVGVSCTRTLEDAVENALSSLAPRGKLAILPFAHFTVANVREN
jgi:nickel-dependent lactate racemase